MGDFGMFRVRIADFGVRNEKERGQMQQSILKDRIRAFAIAVIKFAGALPRNRTADIIARQIIRSGASVGANYRAACRARSRAEFIAKMGIVEEEADETAYWLEILAETGIVTQQAISDLHNEASQIVAMVIASIKTARSASRKA